ncbi:MAG: TMEM165/GDT1 family protein [Actinobacteria bacterium]|nr:MAG: TMEM165/GDT1 family protein [Actinomycetota bacterium]
MLTPLLGSLLLVAIAEFGDKTQLLTLMLAARYRAWQVLVGVAGAIVVLQLLATAVGSTLARLVPASALAWVAGGLFIGFGVWTFLTASDAPEDEKEAARTSRFGATASAFVAFFVAELGDKTQLMTATIAADPSSAAAPLRALGLAPSVPAAGLATFGAVWLGSTLGMLAVNGLAIAVGSAIGTRLPRKLIARVAGVVFVSFGLATLWPAVAGAPA